MYTFKVRKNGKEVPTIHTKEADDKVIAYEVWEKMQIHYEKRWGQFGYSYEISMLEDGKEIHNVDYES